MAPSLKTPGPRGLTGAGPRPEASTRGIADAVAEVPQLDGKATMFRTHVDTSRPGAAVQDDVDVDLALERPGGHALRRSEAEVLEEGEVPTLADVLELDVPRDVRLAWLPRRHGGTEQPRGALLNSALRGATGHLLPRTPGEQRDDLDLDQLVWEVPQDGQRATGGAYAWLAGQAGVIAQLRRHLLQDVGLDRRSVAFMGVLAARTHRDELTGSSVVLLGRRTCQRSR